MADELKLRMAAEGVSDTLAALARVREGVREADAELARLRRSASGRSRDAFEVLGIKSTGQVNRELARLRAAFERLRRDGRTSTEDIARAQVALRQRIREVRGETRELSASFRRAGASIAAAVTAILSVRTAASGLRAVLETGAQFETLQKQLVAVAGGVREGAAAFDFVRDFAARTPLQLQEVLEAFRRLKSFGLDPMDGTLQAVADQTALLGGSQETLQGIVLALGQAWSKERLQGEEALQLIERGVPVWQLLATATGRTTRELQEMSAAGELGRDAIRALIVEMGRGSTGAAQAQMQTFNGVVSNLRDNWARFLDLVARSGVLDFAKEQIEAINNALAEMERSGELAARAQAISDAIVGIAQSLKTLGQVAVAVAPAAGVLLQVFVAAQILKAAAAMRALATATGGLGPAMASAVGPARALAGAVRGALWLEAGLQLARFVLTVQDYRDAVREVAAEQQRLQRTLAATIDAGREHADITTLSRENLRDLTDAELASYRERLQAAADYYRAQRDLAAVTQGPEVAAVTAREAQARGLALRAALAEADAVRRLRDERLRLAGDAAAAEQQLAGIEQEMQTERDQRRRQDLTDKQTALQQGLSAVRQSLAQSLEAERRYTEQIRDLRERQNATDRSIADEIRARRRRGMTEAQAQADLEKQIATKLNDARQSLEQGGDAAGARTLADEARGLVAGLENNQRAEALLGGIQQLLAQTTDAEVKALESARQAERQRFDELSELAGGAERALAAIGTELEKLKAAPNDLTLETNYLEVFNQLVAIRKLQAEVAAAGGTASAAPSAAAPGFSAGTILPGYGGGDRIPARLERGEAVLRKEAVRALGRRVVAALNGGRLPRVMPSLDGITRLASGGMPAPAAAGGPAFQDMGRVELVVGGQAHPIFGERDTLRGLMDALAEGRRGR